MINNCLYIKTAKGGKRLSKNKEEDKKEIIVKAPSKPVVNSQKKTEKATVEALEEERYNVLQIHNKVGKYIGLSSAGVGAVLLILLGYTAFTNQGNWGLLSFTSSSPIVGLWIAAGLISIVAGFLLMGSE